MACNLSAGRQEVCKESVGGIQGVWGFASNYLPQIEVRVK